MVNKCNKCTHRILLRSYNLNNQNVYCLVKYLLFDVLLAITTHMW